MVVHSPAAAGHLVATHLGTLSFWEEHDESERCGSCAESAEDLELRGSDVQSGLSGLG